MEGSCKGVGVGGAGTSQHKGDSLPECIWVGEIKGRKDNHAAVEHQSLSK